MDQNNFDFKPENEEKSPTEDAVQYNSDSADNGAMQNEHADDKPLCGREESSFTPPYTSSYQAYSSYREPPKPKRKNHIAAVIICTALVTAMISTMCSAAVFSHLSAKPKTTENPTVQKAETISKNITIENEVTSVVEGVYEKCSDSVVGISTTAAVQSFFGGSSTAELGEGTGVIYSADGYIITNYHVISNAMQYKSYAINVYFPSDSDTAVPATVVGYNVSGDLAVLKVDKTGLPAMEIGTSKDLKIGQYAIAIGCPGGIEFMGSVSFGIISGLNREISVDNGITMTLIQTDAAINPGNSGGAMLNSKGQLIGINSVKFVDESFEGMGFAIPVDTVVTICDKIISRQNDPDPYIGFEISKKYSSATLSMLGYPTGAVVLSVDDGSPAEAAGLRRGDIITEFAGTVIKDYSTLISIANDLEPKQTVKVKFYRSGRYYDTSLTVGANNAQ